MEATQILFFPLKGVFIEVRNLIFLTQVTPQFPPYRPFSLKSILKIIKMSDMMKSCFQNL